MISLLSTIPESEAKAVAVLLGIILVISLMVLLYWLASVTDDD